MTHPKDLLPLLPWERGPRKATPMGMINELIGDKMTAVSRYKEYADRFREIGNTTTADLFMHIRSEEEHHRDELMKLLGELP